MNPKFLRMLLEVDRGALTVIDDLDQSGNSVLVRAIQAHNVDAVRILIASGANQIVGAVWLCVLG